NATRQSGERTERLNYRRKDRRFQFRETSNERNLLGLLLDDHIIAQGQTAGKGRRFHAELRTVPSRGGAAPPSSLRDRNSPWVLPQDFSAIGLCAGNMNCKIV